MPELADNFWGLQFFGRSCVPVAGSFSPELTSTSLKLSTLHREPSFTQVWFATIISWRTCLKLAKNIKQRLVLSFIGSCARTVCSAVIVCPLWAGGSLHSWTAGLTRPLFYFPPLFNAHSPFKKTNNNYHHNNRHAELNTDCKIGGTLLRHDLHCCRFDLPKVFFTSKIEALSIFFQTTYTTPS